jgi:hypothetical protein
MNDPKQRSNNKKIGKIKVEINDHAVTVGS